MNAPIGWVPGLRLDLLRWQSNAPQSANPGGVNESGRFMAKRSRTEAELKEQTIAECKDSIMPVISRNGCAPKEAEEWLTECVTRLNSSRFLNRSGPDQATVHRAIKALEEVVSQLANVQIRDACEATIVELKPLDAGDFSWLRAITLELHMAQCWSNLEIAKLAIVAGYWPNLSGSDASQLTPGTVVKRVREAVDKFQRQH